MIGDPKRKSEVKKTTLVWPVRKEERKRPIFEFAEVSFLDFH